MTSYILLTAFTWTFKGILCSCRFLWICPYNAIKFLPRERSIQDQTSRQLKTTCGGNIMSLLSPAGLSGCVGERGWFDEESVGNNGETLEECSRGLSRMMRQHEGSDVSTRGDVSSFVRSWRSSKGPHRVFVPHSPMDLELGHRVRIMLPSGRVSTGTIRYLGHLQGEAELHLGVQLLTPDHGLHGGSHRGHSYFDCNPGYGAFVPFHKLLMAWE
ncbi:hypothetical protein KUCAC02_014881 [Chaenocephalus aceratus]|uniref:Uncharacterized protein n=1 Tax=Chaenocephalus aceratus TaxID=36190 RepID=A0ACB9WGN9_CHAAC|nr:hypothetical protein KUCAC02_014881 [Chaenocephalus aceratus]